MSGGEPSSIKQRLHSAAASLHLYAKQRSRVLCPPFYCFCREVALMYRALYRKWRPQRFADVVGQAPIVTALQNQIAAGRIGHAYLFTGTRGTGKTTCAKIFAKAVNCLDHSSPDPCCQCEVCKGIDSGAIMDIIEMDAASNNGVDDIRDLRDEVAYLPSVCRYKVYIIDEVHMLSTQAFNALLKTMEEPPEHVIFILATTEVQKVPVTILSRCHQNNLPPGQIGCQKCCSIFHQTKIRRGKRCCPEHQKHTVGNCRSKPGHKKYNCQKHFAFCKKYQQKRGQKQQGIQQEYHRRMNHKTNCSHKGFSVQNLCYHIEQQCRS